MRKQKSKKEVDAKLVKAIQDLLDDVMKSPKDGEAQKYSLTDKCKVLDRMMKIEAMRLGVSEDDSGSFFKRAGGQSNDDS